MHTACTLVFLFSPVCLPSFLLLGCLLLLLPLLP
jgi:hypothetical protein